MSKKRILIVEDDRALADILIYNLEQAGYIVSVARDGQEGLRQAHLMPQNLIILDVMLPKLDGIEVCRQLRSSAGTKDVLILMLTAKSQELDQLIGFSVGADDYVTKPFSVNVLLQRIKALLRRSETNSNGRDVIVSQGIVIDRNSHKAMAGDKELSLTKSEFALLDVLARNQGRAFNRAPIDRRRTGRRCHRLGAHNRCSHSCTPQEAWRSCQSYRNGSRNRLPFPRSPQLRMMWTRFGDPAD